MKKSKHAIVNSDEHIRISDVPIISFGDNVSSRKDKYVESDMSVYNIKGHKL